MSLQIRKCQDNDLPFVASLHICNLKETYTGLLPEEFLDKLNINFGLDKWEAFLQRENHLLLVAYEYEQFLGFAACNADDELQGCLYLSSLHVSSFSRGKGIGTKLIKAVAQYGLANTYKAMSVCIVKGNLDAGKLYQRLGARHYKDFVDEFNSIATDSQKFIWDELPVGTLS